MNIFSQISTAGFLKGKGIQGLRLSLSILALYTLNACQSSLRPEENSAQAKARIEHISKGHITNHGFSGDRITVSYKPKDSSKSVSASATLKSNTYKSGDSIDIYYNPKNPEGMVYDANK